MSCSTTDVGATPQSLTMLHHANTKGTVLDKTWGGLQVVPVSGATSSAGEGPAHQPVAEQHQADQ